MNRAEKTPRTSDVIAWALIAAVLAILAYGLTPWPWLWVLPVVWFCWVIGRRLGAQSKTDLIQWIWMQTDGS